MPEEEYCEEEEYEEDDDDDGEDGVEYEDKDKDPLYRAMGIRSQR